MFSRALHFPKNDPVLKRLKRFENTYYKDRYFNEYFDETDSEEEEVEVEVEEVDE